MNPNNAAHCPDSGEWRAWLDHEDGSSWLEEHLSSCPECRELVSTLREEAADVRDILSALAPPRLPDAAEIALARERLDWRHAAAARPTHPIHIRRPEPLPMYISRFTTPWRFAASGIASALIVGLLVAFTPQGGALAASVLSTFRSSQVQPIYVSPQSQAEIFKTLNALGNLGTVSAPGANGGPVRPQAVVKSAESEQRTITLAEAAQTIKPLLAPDPSTLPSGVPNSPTVRTVPETQMSFTFDKAKASAYLQSSGHPEVSIPDKYDGATLRVTIPKAVILEYGANQSRNALIVAEAEEVTADVQGKVDLPELRTFILGLPGLPKSVVDQLGNIDSWTDTLPIPVPIDLAQYHSFDAPGGGKGMLLDDNSGIGSAAIWHANGHLYGVAGSIKSSELRNILNKMVAVH